MGDALGITKADEFRFVQGCSGSYEGEGPSKPENRRKIFLEKPKTLRNHETWLSMGFTKRPAPNCFDWRPEHCQ